MVDSVSYIDSLRASSTPTSSTTESSDTLGQNQFLKLMMEQLKHQDPLKPKDNGEFISDMAQFSQVQELQTLSQSFADFKQDMMGSLVVQASGLVGKTVLAEGSTVEFDGQNNSTIQLDLDKIKTDVTVDVYDESGGLVNRMSVGQLSSGSQTVVWDGRNAEGEVMPVGNYTFKAYNGSGDDAEPLKTMVSQLVQSVDLNNGTTMSLNLESGKSVNIDQVQRIGA